MVLLSELKTISATRTPVKSSKFCFTFIVLSFVFVAYSNLAFCQQVIAHNNKGTVIGKQNNDNRTIKITKVYNKVTEQNKGKVLLLNKYLDTTKTIWIKTGLVSTYTMERLRMGVTPIILGYEAPLTLKVENGQILLNCIMYDIEGKRAAKIHNNELVNEEGRNYELHITDRYIEIINEYNIPVLQVDLDKQENSISIRGVTFDENGAYTYILADKIVDNYMGKPFIKMKEAEKDSFLLMFRTEAKKVLQQLH